MPDHPTLLKVFMLLAYRLSCKQDPNMAEIAAGLHLSGPSSVQRHLAWLAEKGYITHRKGKHRAWSLTPKGEASWQKYARQYYGITGGIQSLSDDDNDDP